MKRVHDKLNILIVCAVVAIAAVGYLLIQTGTIDPSMGSGSGIGGVKKAEKEGRFHRNKRTGSVHFCNLARAPGTRP